MKNQDKSEVIRDSDATEQQSQHEDVSIEKQASDKANFVNKSVYPEWTDILALVGVFFLAQLFGAFIKMMIDKTYPSEPNFSMFVAYAVSMIVTIVFAVIHKNIRAGRRYKFGIGLKGASPLLILWGIILVFGVSMVVEPLLDVFPDKYLRFLEKAIGMGGWIIFMTVVCAPILEEILFRGILQGAVAKKWGSISGILVSAAIFGVIHIIPQQAVNAFFVGIVLGYIYMKTKSLWAVILIHAFNNAVAYLTMSLNDGKVVSTRQLIGNDKLYYVVYGVFLALVIVSAFWLVRSIRKPKDDPERN